jgi:hypothetical protein
MRDFGLTNAASYASAPAVGASGDTYWNSTEQALYVSNGTAWVKAGPGTGTYASVRNAGSQSIPVYTNTALTYDTVLSNPAGLFGLADRFTIAQAGFYICGVSATWPGIAVNPGDIRRLFLQEEVGGTMLASVNQDPGVQQRQQTATAGGLFAAGAIVRTYVYQTSAAAISLGAGEARFWIARVG